MIKSIKITNPEKEVLELDLYNPYDSGLAIQNITGLGPVKSNIATIDYAIADGSVYSGSRTPNRNIVFTFRLLEDIETKLIEDSRLKVYKYFPLKEKIRIDITTDNNEVWIEGYIESVEPDIFNQYETVQVSVICPSPSFLHDNDPIELIGTTSLSLQKRAEINYKGDDKSGVVLNIDIYANGLQGRFDVSNSKTNEKMSIDTNKIGSIMSRATELPYRFINGMAFDKGDYIYTLGGSVEPNSIYRYHWKNDDWELLSDNSPISTNAGILIVNTEKYTTPWKEDTVLPFGIFGGDVVFYSGLHILSEKNHYKYNTYYKSWTKVSTIPVDFYSGSAVVYNNEIHILSSSFHYKWNGSSWTQASTVPFTLSKAITYKNEIHIFGSFETNHNKKHYKWNGSSWTSVSTLPYEFDGSSVVEYKNEIHILGGGSGNYNNYTKHYKWNGSYWTKVSTLPYYFSRGCAVVNGYGTELHILGSSYSLQEKKHYKYDGQAWTLVSILPYDFYQGLASWFNDRLHIFGGLSSGNYQKHYSNELSTYDSDPLLHIMRGNSYYKYDTGKKVWTYIGTLPFTLNTMYQHVGMIMNNTSSNMNNSLFVIGSNNSSNFFYRYDGTEWHALSNLPQKYRSIGQLAVIDSEPSTLIYFLCYKSPTYAMYRYSIIDDTWTLVNDTYFTYDIPEFSVLVYYPPDHSIIQLGGGNSATAMYKFNYLTNEWHTESILPVHFNSGGACVTDDDSIWIMGGSKFEDNNQKIIYRYKNSEWTAVKTNMIKNGDKYELSTSDGKKYFKGIRNNIEYNLLAALPVTTDWIHLKSGNNEVICNFVKGSSDISTNNDYYFRSYLTYDDNLKGV